MLGIAGLAQLELLAWEFQNNSVRAVFLLIGLAVLTSGVLLMMGHQREMQTAEKGKLDDREFLLARRKFRRRMTGSLLISVVGMLLASLYWASQPKVFAAIVVTMLGMLVALMAIAFYDMLNIGLQAIADPQDERRDELVQDVLRRREEAGEQEAEQDD